jgi:glutamate racemase
MILGCTHYPLIHQDVASFFPKAVDVLDSSDITAAALHAQLSEKQLLSTARNSAGQDEFLVSDFTETFEASSRMFFGEHVHLTKYPLWE